jgi:spore photoproduct lyase
MDDPGSFAASQAIFSLLSPADRDYWFSRVEELHLTQSEARELMLVLRDRQMWGETDTDLPNSSGPGAPGGGRPGKAFMAELRSYYKTLRESGQDYLTHPMPVPPSRPIRFEEIRDARPLLGRCPVASEKTRCCNLYTLDAVFRCGYDCSYCSIQSFYDEGRISFHGNLKQKLEALDLDPEKRYHIGTGQSSDSLLWGNRDGLLETLSDFAARRPNVLLELKTKSANVDWLLSHELPENMVITWSLNTPSVIANEEHGTADLAARLVAARRCANAGLPIGFHLHPMVRYRGWEEEYDALFAALRGKFDPDELVMVSLGTLTYPKPVLRQIRERNFSSAVLRMDMEEIAGKYSYPREIKREMFARAAEAFDGWRDEVFFYLCMEDIDLWPEVLGRRYPDNEAFETDMLDSYFAKTKAIADRRRSSLTAD